MKDPALDPASILYGTSPGLHGSTEGGTYHLSARVGSDGWPLFVCSRKPHQDWNGRPLKVWGWSNDDDEPIEFWTTDPAITTWNQAKESGCLHNPDFPAARWFDEREQWYQHGCLHSVRGPAWILVDRRGVSRGLYYLNGERLSRSTWVQRLRDGRYTP